MREQTVREPGESTTEASIDCTECGAIAHGRAEGWKAYLAAGFDGLPVEVAAFCPACAAREFGDN